MDKKRKPILYAAALNEDGSLTIAGEAPRKRPYSCVNCGNAMRVKRGTIRRAHFAHVNREFDSTCSPETVLHKAFKIALHRRIQDCIDRSIELSVKWRCQLCRMTHEGNLVKKTQTSKLEYPLGNFVADIALLDKDKEAFCAIEIVVTNPPKEEKVSFYNNSGIWMEVFRLENDEDLEQAFETPLNPTSFDFCPSLFQNNGIRPYFLDDFNKESTLLESQPSHGTTNQLDLVDSADRTKNKKLGNPLRNAVLILLFAVLIIISFALCQWITS